MGEWGRSLSASPKMVRSSAVPITCRPRQTDIGLANASLGFEHR
jgi:hypothetical protein